MKRSALTTCAWRETRLSSYSGLPAPTSEVPQAQSWYSASSNRISGWSYDAAGNVTSVQNMPRTFVYDAENRQTSASVNGTTTNYAYDGNGRRVTKTVGSNATSVFVYDAQGNLIAEYGSASSDSGTRYLTADHLGSTRLVTKADGTADRIYDYLPFGEEIGASYPAAPSGPSQKFTGQERDAESGMDFFKARYTSAPQGRFQSPDPAGMFVADPTNPQSWNLYAYVMNNPLKYIDPTGEECTPDGFDDGQGDTCAMIPQGPNNSVTVNGTWLPVNYGSWNTGDSGGWGGGLGTFSFSVTGYGTALQQPGATQYTISAYHPSVAKCFVQGALDFGLDFTGISMLPGANQDNWTWNSAQFGFDYESVAEGESLIGPSTAVEAVHKSAEFLKESAPAQQAIKRYFKSKGSFVSMKTVAKDAALVGKVAAVVNAAVATRAFYNRYTKCRDF